MFPCFNHSFGRDDEIRWKIIGFRVSKSEYFLVLSEGVGGFHHLSFPVANVRLKNGPGPDRPTNDIQELRSTIGRLHK